MSKDNVIRPVFGVKPRTVEPQFSDTETQSEDNGGWDGYKHIGPLTGDTLMRARKDFLYLLKNMDHATSMRDRLEQMGDIVFGLADFTPDTRSIELRRQGLRSLSLEEICELVANLNEQQVRMQPSYLGALTLEHTVRLDAALSMMKEPDVQG